ncbi:MAG: DUF4258 domain-containing protein [Fischerella sp.]|jgi:hypothetical protein|uniref:DUF4258 domain-containing protein n=1 Tax=Fischerella sp. TaxID=1191 RepID=UPI00185B9FE4|nr:DUF4258 domain-containing protein [Fischerella sp.]NWF58874.1 DUF4258 domain-containing protein [Fischerella sp.]
MDIKDIINALNTGKVIKSRHSISEALADSLNIEEIYFSVEQGAEIIEDYPDAYPLPACLILGWNSTGEPIHSVWAYNQANQTVKLITVYRPDPNRWIDWRIRK